MSLGKSASAGMTMNDLTTYFQHLDKAEIVADWEWLIGKGKLPVLITASGDAFLQDSNDGSIYFLDVTAGEFSLVTKSPEEFQLLLSNKEFVSNHFFVQMIGEMKRVGVNLEKGQVYSFKVPPALGGKYEMDNVEVTSIYVHFSVNGQIHKQIKDVPPGTKIDQVTLEQ
ncbi:T6SS immunity protein Tdi1 domain-containing protein [Marinibactrum halimedae]|uniref:T6SS immunity protein Tdi1 C-terminal domain-containing protein n=1 Tax=Marinibactrum halimedae TaxID=1444977 RepID=A0AA37T5Z0_9GAMM|nr:T6SS immunity protein Tdi1 domain-containing protein [Marinibactrum halimedae]MCD9461194.1 DUF1851 domain-containing protein [Marinibactrum halimedae]GLS26416.1 hypothetical protein GCM10007877_21320 [Marinibactrum halimedae]